VLPRPFSLSPSLSIHLFACAQLINRFTTVLPSLSPTLSLSLFYSLSLSFPLSLALSYDDDSV
jgi:hypothetical protein